MSLSKITPNILDKAIMFISPRKGLDRLKHKAHIKKLEELGYVGASKSRRATKNWHTDGGSADTDDLPYLQILRERSRDRYRNDGLVAGAINTKVISAVGTGLTVQSQIDYEYIGISAAVSSACV